MKNADKIVANAKKKMGNMTKAQMEEISQLEVITTGRAGSMGKAPGRG